MNRSDFFRHYSYILALGVLAWSPIKALVLVAVVVYFAHLLPRGINFFARIMLGFALYFSLNTILAGFAYLLNIALPIEILIVLQLGCIVTLRHVLPRSEEKSFSPSRLPSMIGLILYGMFFALLILPTLRTGGYEIYRKVTFGGDNTSHIELIKAVKERGGYFYEKPQYTGYVITENLAGYPQGLHFNAYVLLESARPIIDFTHSYKRLMAFYYAYSIAIYLAFSALFLTLIQVIQKKKAMTETIVGVSVAGILFSGILFSLFALGFQTQIASLALLLAMLAFLHLSSEERDDVLSKYYLILALLVLVGISFTWLFLLPVAGLIILLYFSKRYAVPTLTKPVTNIGFLALLVIFSALTLIQPATQLLLQTSKTSGVNEIGFTVIPSILIVTSLAILSLACIPLVFKKSKPLWFAAIGSSSFFSLYVYVYQWSRVGEARYYFHKSLFTLILLSSIILVLVIGRFINNNPSMEPRQKKALLVSILLVGMLLSTYNLTNRNDYFQKQYGGGFSAELAVTVGRLIEENPENGKKIITIGSCNRAHDYTASRLAGTLTGEHDIWRQGLISALLAPNKVSLIKSIKIYQKIRSPELIIISTDYNLQKQLEHELNDGYGKEQYIDLDFNHVPKTLASCPHSVK